VPPRLDASAAERIAALGTQRADDAAAGFSAVAIGDAARLVVNHDAVGTLCAEGVGASQHRGGVVVGRQRCLLARDKGSGGGDGNRKGHEQDVDFVGGHHVDFLVFNF